MKIRKVLVGLVASAMIITSTPVGAAITGSDHDFSSQGWSQGQLCITCHTPHNSNTAVQSSPLWNREETTQMFIPYDSNTLDATVGQPDGSSRLCLSCHDGTIAIDSFGGNTGINYIGNGEKIDADLNAEHPISFVYNDALAAIDGKLHMPSTQPSGLGGTVRGDLLRNDKLQCVSCHDIHNQYNNADLLIKSNMGSALCLTCHSM